MIDKPLECACGRLPKAKKTEISGSELWSLECPNPFCGLKPRTVLCAKYADAVLKWNECVVRIEAPAESNGPAPVQDSWLAFSCDIEEHVSKAGNDIEPDVAKAWAWRATALSAIEKGTGGL